MGFRKEMRENFKELFAKMDRLVNLYGTMDGLKEQNEALFDKLMARNWEEYTSSPSMMNRETLPEKKETILSPSFDESSIGEILSEEEIVGK